jgi:hypothetical protein
VEESGVNSVNVINQSRLLLGFVALRYGTLNVDFVILFVVSAVVGYVVKSLPSQLPHRNHGVLIRSQQIIDTVAIIITSATYVFFHSTAIFVGAVIRRRTATFFNCKVVFLYPIIIEFR